MAAKLIVQTHHNKKKTLTLFFTSGFLKIPSTINLMQVTMNASIAGITINTIDNYPQRLLGL